LKAYRLGLKRTLLVCAISVLAIGCGGSKTTKVIVPKDGLPTGTPINDSEAHLMARFEATFDAQSQAEYAKLLTDDFRFHFSAASDPDLVSMYGDNWGRDDETIAIGNLFAGFTNSVGVVIPGASNVDIQLLGGATVDDSTHADSTAYYRRVIVPHLICSLEVPTTPDPTIFSIDARHDIYIVRGDAAVLAVGQSAQADRWYIRQWDDLSVPIFLRKGPVLGSARASTLGAVKGLYR
jgi:hypothetical protein